MCRAGDGGGFRRGSAFLARGIDTGKSEKGHGMGSLLVTLSSADEWRGWNLGSDGTRPCDGGFVCIAWRVLDAGRGG